MNGIPTNNKFDPIKFLAMTPLQVFAWIIKNKPEVEVHNMPASNVGLCILAFQMRDAFIKMYGISPWESAVHKLFKSGVPISSNPFGTIWDYWGISLSPTETIAAALLGEGKLDE